MAAKVPAELRKIIEDQAGIVARRQAMAARMSPKAIEYKLRTGEWKQVRWGVYAASAGPWPPLAHLWAAVLYAGEGALLSHETAAKLHGLVDGQAGPIHVTVPARRRVKAVTGLVIHTSDVPERPVPDLDYERLPKDPERRVEDDLPRTTVADTIIDLAEDCDDVDAVYGWVTRAFGSFAVEVSLVQLLTAIGLRKKLRWRAALTEAAFSAADGAHSALELLWEVHVERPHGLVPSRKQVPFTKPDGSPGRRDREYVPYGVIIELDGRKPHEGKQAEDRIRDRGAEAAGKRTMRYNWRQTRYEGCQSSVSVIRELWRRGWRGRPWPCSPGCPVAALLEQHDAWLEEDLRRKEAWLEAQSRQEAAQQATADRQAAYRVGVQDAVADLIRAQRADTARQIPRRPGQRMRREPRPRQRSGLPHRFFA